MLLENQGMRQLSGPFPSANARVVVYSKNTQYRSETGYFRILKVLFLKKEEIIGNDFFLQCPYKHVGGNFETLASSLLGNQFMETG